MSSSGKFIDPSFVFSLRALNKDCYYQRIQADFTPIIKVAKHQIHFITPKFHDDFRYFTPGFVLPHQQEILVNQQPRHKINFHAKVQKYEEEQTPQVVFQQDPKITYCHVCKKNITDYKAHIKDKSHVRSIHQIGAKKIDVNQYIYELVEKVQNDNANDDQCSQKSEQTKAAKKYSKTKQVAKKYAKSTKKTQKYPGNQKYKRESKKYDKQEPKTRARKLSTCSNKCLRSTNMLSAKEDRINCIKI